MTRGECEEILRALNISFKKRYYDLDLKCLVTQFGTDNHRDILITDSDWVVRYNVAKYCDMNTLLKLVDDPSEDIRDIVNKRLNINELELI